VAAVVVAADWPAAVVAVAVAVNLIAGQMEALVAAPVAVVGRGCPQWGLVELA